MSKVILKTHTDTANKNKPAAAATVAALPLHWNGLVGAAAGTTPGATNGLVGCADGKNSIKITLISMKS